MTHDLAIKPSNDVVKPVNKPYYPSVHISGVKAKLGVGDEVTLKCRVKRATEEDNGTYSCELECNKMTHSGDSDEGGLDSALKKIVKKKQESAEEEADEEAAGMDNDEEESEEEQNG